jgi:hypothetical protein
MRLPVRWSSISATVIRGRSRQCRSSPAHLLGKQVFPCYNAASNRKVSIRRLAYFSPIARREIALCDPSLTGLLSWGCQQPRSGELVELLQQAIHIGRMHAGAGFIQHIQRLTACRTLQFECRLDALRFAARQLGRRLAQTQIAQADVFQHGKSARDGRLFP